MPPSLHRRARPCGPSARDATAHSPCGRSRSWRSRRSRAGRSCALVAPRVAAPHGCCEERERAQEREESSRCSSGAHASEGERSVERIRLWEGERSTREDLAVFGFGYEPSVYVFREKNLAC